MKITMRDLILYHCRFFLSERPEKETFYPMRLLSFNNNTVTEIYASLSVLFDKGAFETFFVFDQADQSSYTHREGVLRLLATFDQNPDQVQTRPRATPNPYFLPHNYGVVIKVKDFKQLQVIIDEESHLFINDETETTNLGYELQRKKLIKWVNVEYSRNKKKLIQTVVQALEEILPDIDTWRTILSMEHKNELQIKQGSVHNLREMWYDDMGHEPMNAVISVMNEMKRGGRRYDRDLVHLTITNFEKLIYLPQTTPIPSPINIKRGITTNYQQNADKKIMKCAGIRHVAR